MALHVIHGAAVPALVAHARNTIARLKTVEPIRAACRAGSGAIHIDFTRVFKSVKAVGDAASIGSALVSSAVFVDVTGAERKALEWTHAAAVDGRFTAVSYKVVARWRKAEVVNTDKTVALTCHVAGSASWTSLGAGSGAIDATFESIHDTIVTSGRAAYAIGAHT